MHYCYRGIIFIIKDKYFKDGSHVYDDDVMFNTSKTKLYRLNVKDHFKN